MVSASNVVLPIRPERPGKAVSINAILPLLSSHDALSQCYQCVDVDVAVLVAGGFEDGDALRGYLECDCVRGRGDELLSFSSSSGALSVCNWIWFTPHCHRGLEHE
jgi:hypothetical protein